MAAGGSSDGDREHSICLLKLSASQNLPRPAKTKNRDRTVSCTYIGRGTTTKQNATQDTPPPTSLHSTRPGDPINCRQSSTGRSTLLLLLSGCQQRHSTPSENGVDAEYNIQEYCQDEPSRGKWRKRKSEIYVRTNIEEPGNSPGPHAAAGTLYHTAEGRI